MSETDHSETSESTIEPFQFDKILENLEHGARDAKESNDFLSYSTLLDIYLNDPSKYSNDEKEQLMGHLLDILTNNKELTFEIGWDLPQLVILYIESDYDFKGPIRSSPCVYKILKIFEMLAINGNPKELFLKCCELLSSLEVSANDIQQEDGKNVLISARENFYEIKVYCVFELIDSCLKRIQTLYPSRFLMMAITAFINLIYNLNRGEFNGLGTYHFILKRAYGFARNYINLPLPDDIDVSKEDLDKITKDEEYLQRKLLTGFLTNVVYLTNIKWAEGYAMDHFSWLQRQQQQQQQQSNSRSKLIFEYEVDASLPDRFVELAYSFDIELLKNFQTFVTESHNLLIPLDQTKSSEELTGWLFEKLVIDYQKTIFTNIVNNSESKEIQDSIVGKLILFTHLTATKKEFNKPTMTIPDVLAITLRLIIPQMVSSSFVNFGTCDLVIFWIWFTLYQQQKLNKLNASSLAMQIEKIPKPLFTIFLQCILFIIISAFESDAKNNKPKFRFMVLTLLTKILILTPKLGYEFIKDSLLNCPYESIKPSLIGVYKELLLNSINSTTTTTEVESLELEKLKISNDSNSKTNAPPLPPRESTATTTTTTGSGSEKSYALTNEKLNDLLEFVELSESETFVEQEQEEEEEEDDDDDDEVEYSIDPNRLSTMASLLNLLISIKNDKLIKSNIEKIKSEILSPIEGKIKKIQNSSKNQYEINAADMLQLAIERFKE